MLSSRRYLVSHRSPCIRLSCGNRRIFSSNLKPSIYEAQSIHIDDADDFNFADFTFATEHPIKEFSRNAISFSSNWSKKFQLARLSYEKRKNDDIDLVRMNPSLSKMKDNQEVNIPRNSKNKILSVEDHKIFEQVTETMELQRNIRKKIAVEKFQKSMHGEDVKKNILSQPEEASSIRDILRKSEVNNRLPLFKIVSLREDNHYNSIEHDNKNSKNIFNGVGISSNQWKNRLDEQNRRDLIDALLEKKSNKSVKPEERKELIVQIPYNGISLKSLSNISAIKVDDILKKMKKLELTFNEQLSGEIILDSDTAELICLECDIQTQKLERSNAEVSRTKLSKLDNDTLSQLLVRSPVVTVMGHVDHGKTTLLDALRKTNTASEEISGITQRLGTFKVNLVEGREDITFFDTPGHAAFSFMRQSAGRLTDIVVLVIAADDGVKTQTIEVLEMLKQNPNVHAVIAMSKCDKDTVDKTDSIRRISNQLLEHGIEVEEYGGNIPIVPVSGITGEGLADLAEAILLQAEMMELRCDFDSPGEGVVIDSGIEKGVGAYVDVMVSWGTFRCGDHCVFGSSFGRIRQMQDANHKVVIAAKAGDTIRITGLKELPVAGDEMIAVESELRAQQIAELRCKAESLRVTNEDILKFKEKRQLEQALNELRDPLKKRRKRTNQKTVDNSRETKAAAYKAVKELELKHEEKYKDPCTYIPAVFKANSHGALAAMASAVEALPGRDEITVKTSFDGIGPITSSDVERAAATGSVPIFTYGLCSPQSSVLALARALGVDIFTHDVIYRFQEEVANMLTDKLPARISAFSLGQAQVQQVFDINSKKVKGGLKVAGCRVTDGCIKNSHTFRVFRDDKVIHTATGASLKRFKERVNEVQKGHECGLSLENYSDFREGDIIEAFEIKKEKRKLGEAL